MKNSWYNVKHEEDLVLYADANRRASGPGSHPFLDALVVGTPNNTGTGLAGPGLSTAEAQSHMSLWVALSSPLLLGFDIRKPIKPEILSILTHPEILEVHKDALAKTGRPTRLHQPTY